MFIFCLKAVIVYVSVGISGFTPGNAFWNTWCLKSHAKQSNCDVYMWQNVWDGFKAGRCWRKLKSTSAHFPAERSPVATAEVVQIDPTFLPVQFLLTCCRGQGEMVFSWCSTPALNYSPVSCLPASALQPDESDQTSRKLCSEVPVSSGCK